MRDMQLGPKGEHLIKSYETCVLYVYDDMRPPVKGRYREWNGEEVLGTLTAGWGHTDAARAKCPTASGKIERGMRLTQAQADAMFTEDMSECVEDCNRSFDTDPTQGEFDSAMSFRFNAGIGNLRKLLAPYNEGDPDGTLAKFPLYNRSKGKVLAGLVRRRAAEQALWKDQYDPLVHGTSNLPHGGVKPDTPTAQPPAHVNPTVIAAGVGGAAEAAHQVSDTLNQVKASTDTVSGLMTDLAAIMHDPWFFLAIVTVGLIAVLWYAHRQHTEA